MSPIAMTLLLVATLSAFAWAAARRWRQLMVGRADPDFRLSGGELEKRVFDTVVYAFGQRKMPNYKNAGLAHMVIFGAFMILLLNTIQLVIRGYDIQFDFWGLLAHDAPIGGRPRPSRRTSSAPTTPPPARSTRPRCTPRVPGSCAGTCRCRRAVGR